MLNAGYLTIKNIQDEVQLGGIPKIYMHAQDTSPLLMDTRKCMNS